MPRKAVYTQTKTSQVPSRAIETVDTDELFESTTPALDGEQIEAGMVLAQVRDIVANENSETYLELVAMLTKKYLEIIHNLKPQADKGDARAIKTTMVAMKEMIDLLGLKAPTKTISASGEATYDLSGYTELGQRSMSGE